MLSFESTLRWFNSLAALCAFFGLSLRSDCVFMFGAVWIAAPAKKRYGFASWAALLSFLTDMLKSYWGELDMSRIEFFELENNLLFYS